MDYLIRMLKAIADSRRIRILKLLEIRPLCVCEITDVLGLATSTVSKHLSILREAGLITDTRDGKWVNYDLNRDPADAQARQMLKMIDGWLADDRTVERDREKVKTVDRDRLCGIG